MGLHDLNAEEWACLHAALLAPKLWAFQLLLAFVGYDAALVACATREIPDEVAEAFEHAEYSAHDLPPYNWASYFLDGVRLVANRRPQERLHDVARRLGMDKTRARKGWASLNFFGCKTRWVLRYWGMCRDGSPRGTRELEGAE